LIRKADKTATPRNASINIQIDPLRANNE